MADISKVTLPNGSTYDIKDATAREQIATITSGIGGGMEYKGVTTTKLVDGSTETTIVINNSNYTPINGDIVIYEDKEFIFATVGSTSTWHEFGSTGSLKALAFKDSATGSVTANGTVSAPTFSGKAKNVSVSGNATVNMPQVTWGVQDINTGTTTIQTRIVGVTQTDVVTPTAKATGANVALNTESINAVENVGTLPSWSASVNGDTLSFSWNTGSLPTTSAKTVATSVKSVTQPTITCGQLQAIVPNTTVSVTSTGSYTPEGTNSAPIFTGTPQTITVK